MSRRLASIPGRAAILWQYLQILRDEEQVSVLVTTHLMEEAERCDRLAIMNEGNLVALGTPAELKSEIGGDVILLDAAHDAGCAGRAHPRTLSRGNHGAGQPGAHRARRRTPLCHRMVEAFPGEIQAISVSKPALEDVFIHRTGHKFWSESSESNRTVDSEEKRTKRR